MDERVLVGLIWNYISLFIMAISGLVFDLLIMCYYDIEILGIFNRAYSWYIVLSQIGVWGIHMSVLKYIPEYEDDIGECNRILISAIVLGVGVSIVSVIAIESVLNVYGSGDEFTISMKFILPAIIFFTINKILLNYINGKKMMKSYAVFQSCRYIMIALVLLACGIWKIESKYLVTCFGIAELFLFLIIFIYLQYKIRILSFPDVKWFKNHLLFGTSILPANMVIELNSKIDILCISFILDDDYAIGLYSFAVLFAEGFYQIFVVIRRILNPDISEVGVQKINEFVTRINNRIRGYLTTFSYIAFAGLIMGYCVICFWVGHREYVVGCIYLAIICFSIVINSRRIMWGNILSQIGYPKEESIVNVVTVMFNVGFNIVLILKFGVVGAAIATAISYCVYSVLLNYYYKKIVGVKL